MNKQEFRARLKALGLTITEFSILTGVERVTVSLWGGFRHQTPQPNETYREFPRWVTVLLDAWEKLPYLLEEVIEKAHAMVDGAIREPARLLHGTVEEN